jgi:hypothetical protein
VALGQLIFSRKTTGVPKDEHRLEHSFNSSLLPAWRRTLLKRLEQLGFKESKSGSDPKKFTTLKVSVVDFSQ